MSKKLDNIQKHLEDIDFRSREERGAAAIDEMKQWYLELHAAASEQPTERLEGQITMLTSILWLFLTKKEQTALNKQAIALHQQ